MNNTRILPNLHQANFNNQSCLQNTQQNQHFCQNFDQSHRNSLLNQAQNVNQNLGQSLRQNFNQNIPSHLQNQTYQNTLQNSMQNLIQQNTFRPKPLHHNSNPTSNMQPSSFKQFKTNATSTCNSTGSGMSLNLQHPQLVYSKCVFI